MGFLTEQLNNEEALKKTMEEYQDLIGDDDEEPLFWFALAETQWKIGRLTSEVKEKALEWISKDGCVALWEESGVSSEGWKKTLAGLKEKLESPMRSEKKIRKPTVINQNLWNVGDIYAYQVHTEESKKHDLYGKYVLLQKMGESPHIPTWMSSEDSSSEPVLMVIHVFNRLYDEIPAIKDIDGVRLLPSSETALPLGVLKMNRLMELTKKQHYPAEHLSFLGNAPVPANNLILPYVSPTSWNWIEKSLIYSFANYQYREYEEVEEGVFRFKE